MGEKVAWAREDWKAMLVEGIIPLDQIAQLGEFAVRPQTIDQRRHGFGTQGRRENEGVQLRELVLTTSCAPLEDRAGQVAHTPDQGGQEAVHVGAGGKPGALPSP
jgi:hypothetical protein